MDALAYLESLPEDEFVLHGSPHRVSRIHPRQTLMDRSLPEYQEYAVYGTLVAEVAILYALIHLRRDWWGWYLEDSADPPCLMVGTACPQPLALAAGFVHVLPRAPFKKLVHAGLVCLAYEEIVPVESVPIEASLFDRLVSSGRFALLE